MPMSPVSEGRKETPFPRLKVLQKPPLSLSPKGCISGIGSSSMIVKGKPSPSHHNNNNNYNNNSNNKNHNNINIYYNN